ncbi:MAG: phosphoribosylamine--glycine ligase [Candidatus Coatesbacteria bacterium]|nr:MAG: phosphoribosylamine--glycine ligase [Candidatus Coatesbacteria bacterium]
MAAKNTRKKKSVLVVGGGGREHALAWAFGKSSQVGEVYVAPGNAGTAATATNIPLGPADIEGLTKFARKEKVDLTVVGPEAPLAEGIVDRFLAAKLPIFGPTKRAAQIESSKIFAKELMWEAGVPTAPAEIFDDVEAARRYIDIGGAPCVVKADGLAAGKGVTVAMTEEEAYAAVEAMMVEKRFGDAGERILIEDYVSGEEASILALTDGERLAVMIPSQDHKRLKDGDAGPNTGGMGAYAPAPVIDGKTLKTVTETVLEPIISVLAEGGTPYRGCLYAGLIVDFEGPKVLEFNCRFGDPEAQAVLPLLRDDLFNVCEEAATGRLPVTRFEWRPGAAVTVVAASKGYPGEYEKGKVIKGLDQLEEKETLLVFHAGTAEQEGKIVTAGGRVLAVTALGPSVGDATKKAYGGMELVKFPGMQYRKDIGHKALARSGG